MGAGSEFKLLHWKSPFSDQIYCAQAIAADQVDTVAYKIDWRLIVCF